MLRSAARRGLGGMHAGWAMRLRRPDGTLEEEAEELQIGAPLTTILVRMEDSDPGGLLRPLSSHAHDGLHGDAGTWARPPG